MPDLSYEKSIKGIVAGIDEVGRGPLCGPVVAAAVILPRVVSRELMRLTDDSKKLSPQMRMKVFEMLRAEGAMIGLGAASAREIEKINILMATFLAMRRAVNHLPVRPFHILVDGNRNPKLGLPCTTIIKGDSISLSIAAASNVAKVIRDSCLDKLAARYPGYGWDKNAGYGTASHQKAIVECGITPHHRRGFGRLLPRSDDRLQDEDLSN